MSHYKSNVNTFMFYFLKCKEHVLGPGGCEHAIRKKNWPKQP